MNAAEKLIIDATKNDEVDAVLLAVELLASCTIAEIVDTMGWHKSEADVHAEIVKACTTALRVDVASKIADDEPTTRKSERFVVKFTRVQNEWRAMTCCVSKIFGRYSKTGNLAHVSFRKASTVLTEHERETFGEVVPKARRVTIEARS